VVSDANPILFDVVNLVQGDHEGLVHPRKARSPQLCRFGTPLGR
jgi:hypothetical protein